MELLQILDIPAVMIHVVHPSSAHFGEVSPDLLDHAIPIGGLAGDRQSTQAKELMTRWKHAVRKNVAV